MELTHTKQGRAEIRKIHLEFLKENTLNYSEEIYKDKLIVSNDKANSAGKMFYYLQVYNKTAARPYLNEYSSNINWRAEKIGHVKQSADMLEEYEIKRKEATGGKRPITRAAEVAQRIRQELKVKFPGVKFQVTCKNYSGGDSVDVNYTDFLPRKEIEKLFYKYNGGHFDGMNDIYEYKDRELEVSPAGLKEIPTTKYLFFNRETSTQVKEDAKTWIRKNFTTDDNKEQWIDNAVYRLTTEMDLTSGFNEQFAQDYPYGIFDR